MRKNCLIVLVILLSNYTFAQNILSWKNYSDMKNLNSVGSSGNIYFAATTGGLFFYDSQNASYITLSKVEGLSSHNLTSMAIDNAGKIWLGTQEGIINIYDMNESGEVRRILDIYNSDKNQKQINHVASNNGKIYVSTNFGISILNPIDESFDETILRFGSLPSESKVNSTYFNNKLYIALDAGVAIQKDGAQNLSSPDSWTSYGINSIGSSTNVNAICLFNGMLFAGTDRGVYVLNNDTWNEALFSGANVVDIFLSDSKLYIALDHSLYEYDGVNPTRIYINNESTITGTTTTEDNKILLASNTGLWVLGNEEPVVLYPDGPAANTFQSLTVDAEGNLWVGSGRDVYGVGVFKFDRTSWELFNTSNTPEMKSNSFHMMNTLPDNTIYMMNWGKGYTTYKDGVFETVDQTNSSLMGIPENPDFVVVTGVQKDSRGNLWFLTLRSANRKHLNVLTTDGSWYSYSIDSPYLGGYDDAEHLVIDAFDNKWFAVTGGNKGLYYFNERGTFTNTSDDVSGRLTESDGLRNTAVTSLAIDQRGELWVGTSQGINIIPNPSTRTVHQSGVPVRGQNINCIAVDPINRKWLGTNQGLFLMSSDGIQAIEQFQSTNSPIPSDEIKSIAIDEREGIVYIGTDFGLTMLQTSSIAPVASYEELKIYPNPFYVGQSYTQDLKIDGLMKNSSIKILSIEGKLIKEYSTSGGRLTFWDGKDEEGNFVSSGIYIIVAYDEEVDNVTRGKVAVFNK